MYMWRKNNHEGKDYTISGRNIRSNLEEQDLQDNEKGRNIHSRKGGKEGTIVEAIAVQGLPT